MQLPEFFGLDIGNHSIKIAQAKYRGDKAELTGIGHVETEGGVIGATDENAKNQLVEKIKQVREAARISTKYVVAALPESSIFTRLILLPDLPEDQLEQSLFYEAKQYLPIPTSDVQLDHIPIAKKNVEGKSLIQALLVAAPKTVVNSYMDIVGKAGLELIAIETETMATGRSITYQNKIEGSAMVLDFGSKGTDLSVVRGQFPIFSQSLGTGSDALTKAIASDFGLEYAQAEQYKRTYGLLPGQAEGKIAKTLTPVMQIIINEINKTVNYFRAHLQESTPSQIFIVGDGAKLPGLPEFLSKNLGIPARVTDPVDKLKVDSKIKSEVAQLATVGFTVSIGLSLKKQ
ncbi:MAG: type IV pilus assembly protein PilM, partial [Candidatus Dojkabacteria bacterium]